MEGSNEGRERGRKERKKEHQGSTFQSIRGRGGYKNRRYEVRGMISALNGLIAFIFSLLHRVSHVLSFTLLLTSYLLPLTSHLFFLLCHLSPLIPYLSPLISHPLFPTLILISHLPTLPVTLLLTLVLIYHSSTHSSPHPSSLLLRKIQVITAVHPRLFLRHLLASTTTRTLYLSISFPIF